MILQLAVQGKLVEQNPDDEPASELLKRIEAEKTELVRKKIIKPQKPLPEIRKEEKPFATPDNWSWCHLGDICTGITDGVHKTPKYQKNGIPFLSIKNISSGYLDFENCKFISLSEHQEINKRCNPEKGDILFCRIGTLGKSIVIKTEDPFSIFVSLGLLKFPQKEIFPLYLEYTLNTQMMYQQFDKVKAGGSHTNKLNLFSMPGLILPLPPLEEQKRIVAKVDQLMALCDQLEAQQQKRSDLVKQTRISALEALANAQRGEELQVAWKRVEKNLPTLFESPEDVEDLKKCILQNAVMGKLVPQNPDDEPASELLKKIAKEKAELIKKGEIKRQNPLPEIRDDEKPFEVPTGWEWCRLNDLGYVIGGGTPSKSNQSFWSGSIPWISPKDMKVDYIYDAQDHISNDAISNSSVKLIPPNSVLMVLRGMILAHSFPLAITERVVTINQDMKALRLYLPEMSKFSLVLLKGCKSRYLKIVERSSHGTCRLDTDKLFSSTIALPPLEEQKRIVKKTQSLLSLCDTLQKQLAKSRKVAEQLAQSVVVSITGISPEKQPEKKLNDWIEEPEKAEIRIVEAQVNQK
nr:restriction endonuclease subunit S [Desulforegula conservatrix]